MTGTTYTRRRSIERTCSREASILIKDKIQAIVIRRAGELKLTSYAIAKLTQGQVSENHVRAYLTHQKSMGSHKLQHVLVALRLKIEPDN